MPKRCQLQVYQRHVSSLEQIKFDFYWLAPQKFLLREIIRLAGEDKDIAKKAILVFLYQFGYLEEYEQLLIPEIDENMSSRANEESKSPESDISNRND